MLRVAAWFVGIVAVPVAIFAGVFVVPPLLQRMAARFLYEQTLQMGKDGCKRAEHGLGSSLHCYRVLRWSR
jgi:hypothetical protein